MSLKRCKRELEEVIAEYEGIKQALLPCLHIAQEKCGYLSEEIILFLAKKLDLPKVEVYSVVSFYSMFNLEKQGAYIIRVCVSLPCYLKGSKEILEVLKEELDITAGQTTPDKKFTIEAVSCLGVCDQAPAMMVNEEVCGNLTPQKVKEIIGGIKKNRKVG